MTDDELKAAIREVRDRAHDRTGAKLILPDLMPLVHARDAAEAKVAAIGTVNPRRPGLVSSILQKAKRLIARALDWHVREQVEFNRASMAATQATIEALNETNRALTVLSAQVQDCMRQLGDHRNQYEIYTLRNAAELQASFKAQVYELSRTLAAARVEQEKLIHRELRLMRQRSALPFSPSVPMPSAHQPVTIDWLHFADRFRGPEDFVREHQRRYLARFKDAPDVLDIGCGRGEFLEMAREAGFIAHGIDSHPEFVALCRGKGLDARPADMFEYLASLPDATLGGAFCSHVVEHLQPSELPRLIEFLARKLKPNAPLVFETPNAESVSVLTSHFFMDPTHVRPVPAALLSFYLEEAGFGSIESEAILPGGLDCAVYARKL